MKIWRIILIRTICIIASSCFIHGHRVQQASGKVLALDFGILMAKVIQHQLPCRETVEGRRVLKERRAANPWRLWSNYNSPITYFSALEYWSWPFDFNAVVLVDWNHHLVYIFFLAFLILFLFSDLLLLSLLCRLNIFHFSVFNLFFYCNWLGILHFFRSSSSLIAINRVDLRWNFLTWLLVI